MFFIVKLRLPLLKKLINLSGKSRKEFCSLILFFQSIIPKWQIPLTPLQPAVGEGVVGAVPLEVVLRLMTQLLGRGKDPKPLIIVGVGPVVDLLLQGELGVVAL